MEACFVVKEIAPNPWSGNEIDVSPLYTYSIWKNNVSISGSRTKQIHGTKSNSSEWLQRRRSEGCRDVYQCEQEKKKEEKKRQRVKICQIMVWLMWHLVAVNLKSLRSAYKWDHLWPTCLQRAWPEAMWRCTWTWVVHIECQIQWIGDVEWEDEWTPRWT